MNPHDLLTNEQIIARELQDEVLCKHELLEAYDRNVVYIDCDSPSPGTLTKRLIQMMSEEWRRKIVKFYIPREITLTANHLQKNVIQTVDLNHSRHICIPQTNAYTFLVEGLGATTPGGCTHFIIAVSKNGDYYLGAI